MEIDAAGSLDNGRRRIGWVSDVAARVTLVVATTGVAIFKACGRYCFAIGELPAGYDFSYTGNVRRDAGRKMSAESNTDKTSGGMPVESCDYRLDMLIHHKCIVFIANSSYVKSRPMIHRNLPVNYGYYS